MCPEYCVKGLLPHRRENEDRHARLHVHLPVVGTKREHYTIRRGDVQHWWWKKTKEARVGKDAPNEGGLWESALPLCASVPLLLP
jgi:hypothetical protein